VADISDEELWAPFLTSRTPDRQAARLQAHALQDDKRGQRHPPRRAAALSRDEIVRTAIRVADTEGADAVTMRRIARELNAGTMSLYWHVASKEELLDLMIDSLQGDQPTPQPSGDWRHDLQTLARTARGTLHQHRWMIDFIGGRPPTGPRTLQNAESALAIFDGQGVDAATAIDIVTTVSTYVLGAVLREVQEHNEELRTDHHLAGLTEEEFRSALADFTSRVRATGRYPRLVGLIEAGYDPDAAETRDSRFEFGLDCLLDGIGARVPGLPRP
jgi:AcrR family transcriptional regulator